MAWFLYLLECRDGSVYTGIATDVERRFADHAAGRGARYTRSFPPLRVLARFAFADRSAASRAEWRVKRLDAAAKRRLCTLDAAGAAAWFAGDDAPGRRKA